MRQSFRLKGLDCASCAAKIERAVSRIPGVSEAAVSFMTSKMVIEGSDERFDEIVEAARDAVKKYEPDVQMTRV